MHVNLRALLLPVLTTVFVMTGCGDDDGGVDAAADTTVDDGAFDAGSDDTGGDDTGADMDAGTDAATDASEDVSTDSAPPIDVMVPTDFRPCGDALWSWAWAGEDSENVELGEPGRGRIQRIRFMGDLSGNGRHYHNRTGAAPAYLPNISWEEDGVSYSTDLPIVAANVGDNAHSQYMFQDERLDADGPFYLAFAGLDSRRRGGRDIWGTSRDNYVSLDQSNGRVYMTIAGEGFRLAERGAVPPGGFVLEIWRDADGQMHARANGREVTGSEIINDAVFSMSGIGTRDPESSAGWDDGAFEYVVCKGPTSASDRDEVDAYLRAKWTID